MSMTVIQPGILSLLQDGGRSGKLRLGLTNGGPLDNEAFHYCHRLLGNAADSTVIEVSVGGLQLESQVDTFICVTGATMPLYINDEERSLWRVHPVHAGDRISLEFANTGCRSYLGVADGFNIEPCFGSTATVMRE
jgi:allophanate hydrolase subunit 2